MGGNLFYPSSQIIRSQADITGISKANPGSVTAVAHGFQTGDEVYVTNVGGMVEVNNRRFTITRTGADTFTIGVNTSSYTTYTSGGTAYQGVGTLANYNAGDAEGMIPLLESGGKFNADRIPAISGGGGLRREGARKVLSGASVEWETLPAGIEIMRLVFAGMSGSAGGANVLPYIRMGDSGYDTSGYLGTVGHFANSASLIGGQSDRFKLLLNPTAEDIHIYGQVDFTHIGDFRWQVTAQVGWSVPPSGSGPCGFMTGALQLSGDVANVRLGLNTGSFDAGIAALFTDQS